VTLKRDTWVSMKWKYPVLMPRSGAKPKKLSIFGVAWEEVMRFSPSCDCRSSAALDIPHPT
jgi:hypothetical protein